MQAVFFDIDGTLVDHALAERKAAGALCRAHEGLFGPDCERFLDRWCKVSEQGFAEYLAGRESFQAQRRSRVRELAGRPLRDDEADELFAEYLAVYKASWQVFPDALDCLKRLRPYRVAAVSNGDLAQQRSKLAQVGLSSYLKWVVASGDVGCAKPNPGIFLRACERVGVLPAEAVFVGDGWENDVKGAQAAGLTPIWLNRHDAPHPPGSGVWIARSLSEVPAILGLGGNG